MGGRGWGAARPYRCRPPDAHITQGAEGSGIDGDAGGCRREGDDGPAQKTQLWQPCYDAVGHLRGRGSGRGQEEGCGSEQ